MGYYYGSLDEFEEEEEKRKIADVIIFRRLISFLKARTSTIAIILIALFIGAIASSYTPVVFQRTIDVFVNGESLPVDQRLSGISMLVLLAVILQFLSLVSNSVETRLMGMVTQGIIRDIRQDMFNKLQGLSLRYFAEGRTGEIVSKLTNDVDLLSDFFSSIIEMVIEDTIPIFISLYFMFSWNVQLSLISVGLLPIFLIPALLIRVRARGVFRKARETIADITSQIEENVSGIRVIQSLTREKQSQETFEQANMRNLRATVSSSAMFAFFGSGTQALMGVAQIVVIFFGAQFFFSGMLSIGQFFAFQLYLQQLFGPITDISTFYNQYESSMAASERIFGLLSEPIEMAETDGEPKIDLPPVVGKVEYSHVTFGYDLNIPVLKDINLVAPAKQTLAIVGPTGAGKTSLINLLARFYEPQEGAVLIDGYDVKSVTKRSLRRQMGVVLQETFLFQGTIKENIRYGRLDASDEEIFEASKRVGAHDFIMRLPQGYDMNIRERATNISVGQRQMISFARALLANPRILVLDEATSSVDPYTEYLIQEGLQELLKGRTALVIAHRLSTVRNADMIVVINNGIIEEKGNHKELIAKGGLYSHLYNMQFRESQVSR
ncbi:MAG: ABC transporter ATP-binding protein [Candidatus Bathyarchaeota archaeon]